MWFISKYHVCTCSASNESMYPGVQLELEPMDHNVTVELEPVVLQFVEKLIHYVKPNLLFFILCKQLL